MRKLIVQEYVSIDGFAADRERSTSYFDGTKYHIGKEVDKYMLSFIDSIDAIILGKNTYEMFLSYWPEIDSSEEIVSDSLNSKPKYICSKSLNKVSWGKWDNAILLKENCLEKIQALKNEGASDLVVWGSLTLTKSLLLADLVDEIHLFICPVAIGKGYQFIPEEFDLLKLKLIETKTFDSGVILVKYQIRLALIH